MRPLHEKALFLCAVAVCVWTGAASAQPVGAPPDARPVAGGRIAPTPSADGVAPVIPDVFVYEVWRTDAGDVWLDVYVNPEAAALDRPSPPAIRLPATAIRSLDLAAARHAAEPAVTSIGVGVSGGDLSMSLTQRWPVATLAALLASGVLLVGLTAWGLRTRRRARTLAETTRNQTASREAERARVAREIHDGPVQDLVHLSVTLATEPDADAARVLERLRSVSGDLRALAAGLRPPSLDHLGLAAALEDLAERWSAAPRPLAVRVTCTDVPPLSPDAELAVYRLVQEALTNAHTHGQARTAWVFVRGERHVLDVLVRDDGRGLPPEVGLGAKAEERLAAGGHLGLVGMAERAREHGATLTIGPGPGRSGTEVHLVVPARRIYARRASTPTA